MNIVNPYRLVPRGRRGLACDETGVMLGEAPLVIMSATEAGPRAAVCSAGALATVLELAYGAQPAVVVARCHRGLTRAATALDAGDLAKASLEAVLIGLPDLTPWAAEKLAWVGELAKGDAWQNEPRVPKGQTGGGQWTTGGGGSEAVVPPAPLASHGQNATTGAGATRPKDQPAHPLNGIVYHPETDKPALLLTGGAEEEDARSGMGGNRAPDDFRSLQDVFPGLKDNPGIAIPLAPIDGYFGFSASANAANLAGTEAVYFKLTHEIQAIDPKWRDEEFQPLEDMTWQGRANVIKTLLIERAVTYYRVRGDIGPLQVETLKFLQDAVDTEYAEAVRELRLGQLRIRLSPGEAIGNRVDEKVRDDLKEFFNEWGVSYGRRQSITVNNRDHSTPDLTYRIPDARIGKVSFDWSLVMKTISEPQIRGFFAADSEPDSVVIIRPSQLGRDSTYLIPRPATGMRR